MTSQRPSHKKNIFLNFCLSDKTNTNCTKNNNKRNYPSDAPLSRITSAQDANMGSNSHNPDESYAQFFIKNLRQLHEENILIDISFTQADTVIKGHRVILAALSPVLRGIFTKKQQTMSADHISPEALSCLVNFVYKHEAVLDKSSLTELHKTSELLSIRQVQNMVLKIMQKFNLKDGIRGSSLKAANYEDSFTADDTLVVPERRMGENGEQYYVYWFWGLNFLF